MHTYEIRAWKQSGCSLEVKVAQLSQRETFSREINKEFGEGGGLNANYRAVEAVAIAASIFGQMGLTYGVDFVFKTVGDGVSFDFRNDTTRELARRALAEARLT